MPILAIPVLVVAAIGYWVLVTASKEQNAGLKKLGNIIGWVTMVVTAIAFILALISPILWPGMMHRHMMMSGEGMGAREQMETMCGGMMKEKGMMGGEQGMMPPKEGMPPPAPMKGPMKK